MGMGGERLTKSSEDLRMWAEEFIAWGQVCGNEGRVNGGKAGKKVADDPGVLNSDHSSHCSQPQHPPAFPQL